MILRDQIHGDIEFSDAETKLIKTKSFERLRYIKQLAFVENVFPGASHNRYQHSLGVCKCVSDMYNALVKNSPEVQKDGDLELVRMMGLIHDLGHSPFSHASEELSSITHEERLSEILEKEKKNIILAHDYDIESWDLLNQVYMGNGLTYLSDGHLHLLNQLMDNFIDADKLDYLERDSLNCGVKYGSFDRQGIVNNLIAVTDPKGHQVIGLKEDGIQALEGFILARYYMFSQVYMHPMERIARYQYVAEMKKLLPNGKYPDDINKFLQLDDTKFSRKLKFLQDNKYACIYDGDFNQGIYEAIKKKLGTLVLVDAVKKNIFRRDETDNTIYIQNSFNKKLYECEEVSPILKGIEFSSVHRLRVYALKEDADIVKQEVLKVVERCADE